jgi:hypothetical protein
VIGLESELYACSDDRQGASAAHTWVGRDAATSLIDQIAAEGILGIPVL